MSGISVDSYSGGLPACLEAVLMSADCPLTTHECAQFFGMSDEFTQTALEDLQRTYEQQKRGFALRSSVRGWAFVSAQEYDPIVSAFLTHGAGARLSQAALETLAIIAYKQPMTRAAVTAIRGVASDGVVRSLISHGLIAESGADDESRAKTLVTTDLFLEKMGISSLDQLAPLAPFLPSREAAEEALTGEAGADEADSAGTSASPADSGSGLVQSLAALGESLD